MKVVAQEAMKASDKARRDSIDINILNAERFKRLSSIANGGTPEEQDYWNVEMYMATLPIGKTKAREEVNELLKKGEIERYKGKTWKNIPYYREVNYENNTD